eukprot:1620054-Pyramimonas_sp.AAC.1
MGLVVPSSQGPEVGSGPKPPAPKTIISLDALTFRVERHVSCDFQGADRIAQCLIKHGQQLAFVQDMGEVALNDISQFALQ